MIKLSSYALTMALLTYSPLRATAVNENCGVNGTVIATFTGECTYEKFEDALSDKCNITALFPAGDDATIEISDICAYSAPTQFVEIQGTYQKDRRYFAGGGILVDGDAWSLDAARLKRFEDNMHEATLIAWPEYAARFEYNEENGLGDNGYPTNMNLDESCDLNTAMCCFTDDSKVKTFAANSDAETDVCHHDLHKSPQSNHIKEGWSIFPGSETSTHCVGFTWKDGEDELIGNMMYDVSLRNTITKGYRKGVPGAPMCGCIEHMPVVEAASCRTATTESGDITYTFTYDAATGEISADNVAAITYSDCAIPDLAKQYKDNWAGTPFVNDIDKHLVAAVGGCEDEVVDYLNEEQFLHQGTHPTKYVTPDEKKWSDLVVGEGIWFLPPDIVKEMADAAFRALIEADCKDANGESRHCIVRRVCSSCRAESHRDIFYKRKTELPTFEEVYLLDMFMNNWYDTKNKLAYGTVEGDFELYSSYEDALAGTNEWTKCHFNQANIGFPHSCGPTGYVYNEWNSYTHHVGSGYAQDHGFYVEKP